MSVTYLADHANFVAVACFGFAEAVVAAVADYVAGFVDLADFVDVAAVAAADYVVADLGFGFADFAGVADLVDVAGLAVVVAVDSVGFAVDY